MIENIYIEQHIQNTCDLIIQHIKNVLIFQKNINKSLGWHSRFMENLFHPEDALIFKGYSKTIFNDKESGTIKTQKEHIVPMTYLLNELWLLIEQKALSDKELSTILKRNLGVAYISDNEAKKLDTKFSGLKTKMPDYWNIISDDPLDRLKAVGIILVNEDGQEVNTLK
ncbi:hypothetical protein [Acinetobacter sp.]|uniref:hypothetical protein n=1 Tax=Acinetobacter sp. TaxID=472 RepID=UPI0028A93674|nr:hypothetical protein [Acinetobacter sp.]